MALLSPPSLLVLHGLRLAGFKPAEKVAELVGLAVEQVQPELDRLRDQGLATYREGRLSGWSLTPDGRAEGERRLAAELDEAGCRDAVRAAYEQFLTLNGQMLAVCTDWQMKDPQTLNDHADADYDAKVIAKLAEIDAEVQPICARLGTQLERFAAYGGRLADALAKVQAGEADWFTKPMIASYHTVWFELHEDLLATLNIDRAAEGSH
ncbi:MAG: transcriptional regulator [Acidimicrobiales bacterium]|nr:transcriptional regulator [Acidimicrobiales bacterium]